MKIKKVFKKIWNWLSAADVAGMPKDRTENETLTSATFVPPGRVINSEITRRPISAKLGDLVETTYESPDGLVTCREVPTHTHTCCDKLIDFPYAVCSIPECKRWICGEIHHFLCFRCGRSLCLRCRQFFPNTRDPNGGMVPLCPEHYALAEQTGEIDGEWE